MRSTPTPTLNLWYGLALVTAIQQDIAIIGGGVASAALAKTLSRRGKTSPSLMEHQQAAVASPATIKVPFIRYSVATFMFPKNIWSGLIVGSANSINQAAQSVNFDHNWCGVNILMWDEGSTKKPNRMASNFHNRLNSAINARNKRTEKIGLPVDKESVYFHWVVG
ncbi:hypothetical protein O9929_09845 [Vibrio lentus]|nr:hypothetical protein [Vibrio lentus]